MSIAGSAANAGGCYWAGDDGTTYRANIIIIMGVIPLAMLIHGVNPLREPEATYPFPLWLTGHFCRRSGSPPLVLLSGQGANLRNPLTAQLCRDQESNRRHYDTDPKPEEDDIADWPSFFSHRSDPGSNSGLNQSPSQETSLLTTEPPAYKPHGRGGVV